MDDFFKKSDNEIIYVFTKEIKKWGVEAGDIYNPFIHVVVGGTNKLIEWGWIVDEKTYGI